MKTMIFALLTAFSICCQAADNVVLVTIDGLRWQELFSGIDKTLAQEEKYNHRSDFILEQFWDENPARRAEKLMPFLHNTVFKQGRYAGNRKANSCARVSNEWYFSYPGYSEILTGRVDPGIDSNQKKANPNRTFMEQLNETPAFKDKVAAFASWDVFPYIFNVNRSKIPVNIGDEAPVSQEIVSLNRLSHDLPRPWKTVRFDVFTHRFALNSMRTKSPRVLYVSYGETDDFAHDGKYDEYILAANRTDRFIRELWAEINNNPAYKDNTVLFITTDHGRGSNPIETWQHHASEKATKGLLGSLAQYTKGIVGSNDVWMAAIGAGVSDEGLVLTQDDCLTSDRIAATMLKLLEQNFTDEQSAMGSPMEAFIE
jgi:hypothetical protein